MEEYSAFGRCCATTLNLVRIDYGRRFAGAVAAVVGLQSIGTIHTYREQCWREAAAYYSVSASAILLYDYSDMKTP